MKLLSAYETPTDRVFVVEIKPAVVSALNVAAVEAVTETVRWGLDVPVAVARREMRLLLQQANPGAPPVYRRLSALEGIDL